MTENQAAVPNHMVWAVVSTVIATLTTFAGCCCMPIGLIPGIFAIVYANKVTAFLAGDNIEAAKAASKTAETWCWVTSIVGGLALLMSIGSLFWNLSALGGDVFRQFLR